MNAASVLPSLQEAVSPATRYWQSEQALLLEGGATLANPVVAYQTWGNLKGGGKVVLVCHALTGSADVCAWWPGLIGPGQVFDPDTDFIVCSNILGGCYGTTGPASLNPSTGLPYGPTFPEFSIRDMVKLQRRLLLHLGIDKIDIVIGASLGGMQALEWAAMYPDAVGAIVPVAVGATHSAWCIGISAAQRAAIAADANWQGGNYYGGATPDKGLAAARMMAMCTYRSRESFEDRFGRETSAGSESLFAVDSYLQYQGAKLNDRFDANSYIALSRAMHTHDLGRARGDLKAVLQSMQLPALVVSISSDVLYPADEQRALASNLGNANYVEIESLHGHDGFLLETDRLQDVLRSWLSNWLSDCDAAVRPLPVRLPRLA